MKTLPVSLLIFVLFAVFSLVPVSAQSGSKKSGLKFTCLLMGDLPDEEVFYKDGGSYIPFEFKKGRRSEAYYLKSAELFGLFISVVNEEGEEAFELVGSAPLIADSQQMLFVVFPAGSESGFPLRVIGLDDSSKGFPPGSFRFGNFTDTPMLVKVREKTTKLEPGKMTVVDSQSTADGGMVPVTYGSVKGEVLHFTRLYSHAQSREMVFIGKSNNPKRKFEFKFVPQNVAKSAQ